MQKHLLQKWSKDLKRESKKQFRHLVVLIRVEIFGLKCYVGFDVILYLIVNVSLISASQTRNIIKLKHIDLEGFLLNTKLLLSIHNVQ